MSKPLREQFFDIMRKYGIESFVLDNASIDYVGSGGFVHAYRDNVSSSLCVSISDEVAAIFNPEGSEPGDDNYMLVLTNDFKVDFDKVYKRGVDY